METKMKRDRKKKKKKKVEGKKVAKVLLVADIWKQKSSERERKK